MSTEFDNILWEDLARAQQQLRRSLVALERLAHAIQQGQIDQPTRPDDHHLSRLLVLADLLLNEIQPWVNERVAVRRNGHHIPQTAR